MFIVSNEKIWKTGKNGQRESLRKDFSGVSLFRFELAKRKSTNEVTGGFRFVSTSGKYVAAEAVVSGIYGVHLENDVLKLSRIRSCIGISQYRASVSSQLRFSRNTAFMWKTENCTTNTTAGVLTRMRKRCGKRTVPTLSHRLFQLRSRAYKGNEPARENGKLIEKYEAKKTRWKIKQFLKTGGVGGTRRQK